MKKLFLITLFIFSSTVAKAEVGLQLSAHHHYWNNAIGENSSHAAAFGVGLGYFRDRLYFTGAYTYNNHDRKRVNDSSKVAASFPLTEVDLGVGYNIATNISAYIGYHYQNIDNKDQVRDNQSFYESGHGLGLGVKFNQMLINSWVLHQAIGLSTLWMNNEHESLTIEDYQDYSLNGLLGIMYRLTPMHSISLDVSYKGSSLTTKEETLDSYRGYLKTGVSLLVVF